MASKLDNHHLNYTNPSNFFVQFLVKDDIFKYYIISTKLPDISYGTTSVMQGGKLLYLPGNSIDEGTLEIEFLTDEELYVYTDLLELQKTIMEDLEEVTMQVIVTDNDAKPILKFDYYNINVPYISGPLFSTQDDTTEIITTTTINFSKMQYTRDV